MVLNVRKIANGYLAALGGHFMTDYGPDCVLYFAEINLGAAPMDIGSRVLRAKKKREENATKV